MDEKEKIRIARIAMDKRLSYEDLRYSDDMYGNESYTEMVWNYVEECEEMGTTAFNEKYKTKE